jgi:hypothetical protein
LNQRLRAGRENQLASPLADRLQHGQILRRVVWIDDARGDEGAVKADGKAHRWRIGGAARGESQNRASRRPGDTFHSHSLEPGLGRHLRQLIGGKQIAMALPPLLSSKEPGLGLCAGLTIQGGVECGRAIGCLDEQRATRFEHARPLVQSIQSADVAQVLHHLQRFNGLGATIGKGE